jgi:hypothetical protein
MPTMIHGIDPIGDTQKMSNWPSTTWASRTARAIVPASAGNFQRR